ncbi:MAG: hypothetical protein PHF63_03205, partial [Herbinix sp.]|nr:hypothetical protein [Herbinix sp.]
NPNAINQFLKGSDFYMEGEPVFSVAMIVKGRVLIHNDGAKIIVGSGSFLGINDLYLGRYQSTYTAYDELLIYVFPISRMEELDAILSANKDYHGFMVASFYKIIYELDQIYQGLIKQGAEIYQFLTDTYQNYVASATQRGFKVKQSKRISTLGLLESDIDLISDRINYYKECKNLPMDAVKLFYSYGNTVTIYQVEDQVSVVNQQMDTLKKIAEDFIAMAECLVDDTDACLFHLITQISSETDNISGMELLDIMDSIIEKVNKAELFAERMLGKKLKVDRKMMEEGYHILLTGNMIKDESSDPPSRYSKVEAQNVLTELKDSFDKILEYSGINGDKAEQMKSVISDFIDLKDKNSTEEHARNNRRQLVENHYEIYKLVFLRAYKEKQAPRLMDLFMKYGFADDRLLTNEQILSLYFLQEEETVQNNCNVYNIKSWLTLIYEGKREPSKNEFDLEYHEMLASLKKQGKLSDKEISVWLTDPEKRLEYEIQNMFRYNNRTTCGQILSFVPVLHKDQWSNDIERMFITVEKVNAAVAEIRKVDFSVFDREVLYVNKEKNIVKEYIMKRIYPDIILMPNIGSNGIMWQEISGKRRDSAGRFVLPIFTEVNIKVLLTRILGKFRWELCRTLEGSSWNDIKHKSLTSEYTDYLQFYRKNKELSEDKKEKIKQQIQKGRNSSREIFVLDYELWINNESVGAIKLNKLVREIMATYCPFSKELREELKIQPQFEEAMIRYYREKLKKVREVEGRYRLLQKEKIEITPELIETLNYYREL